MVKKLEIVENGNIDLILLDVVMPELDGYEVCEILKQNDKTKDIPIIFVTANKETDDEEKGFQKEPLIILQNLCQKLF